MLILTRKLDEILIIDDKIEILVVDISKDTVKLGIKAPRSISVHRKEVYENIKKEMEEAAQSNITRILKKKKNKFSFKKNEKK